MRTLGAFGHLSRDRLEHVLTVLGEAAPVARHGVADIWNTARGEAEAEAETAWMRRLGFETEYLDGAALRRLDPAWGQNVRGACIHADGLSFDPAEFCDALSESITARGGRVRSAFTVTGLSHGSQGWTAESASGDAASARQVVLAAGVWSPPIAAVLGGAVRLQPAKGYHVSVALQNTPVLSGVLRERKVAVTPLPSGVRLAGTLELSGLNHRLVPHRLAHLRRAAAEYLPQVAAAVPTSPWCGLRPCTAHGLPVVGRLAAPNAWIATGHGMMGLTLASGTGHLIVSDMCGEDLPRWAAALQPIRCRSA